MSENKTWNFDNIGDSFKESSLGKIMLAWKLGKVSTADGISNPWLASLGYSSMYRNPIETFWNSRSVNKHYS